jgi:hypothetical protein
MNLSGDRLHERASAHDAALSRRGADMTIPPKPAAGLKAGLIGIGLAAGAVSCGGGGGNDMGPGMTAAAAPQPMPPSQMATTEAAPDQRAEPAPPADAIDTAATPRM